MSDVRSKLPEAELLAAVLEPMAMLDEHSRVLAWNPAAERALGYSPAEALGRPLGELLGVSLPEEELPAAAPEWEGGQVVEARGADGQLHLLELSLRTYPKDGRTLYLACLRDQTPLHRARQEVKALQAETERLAAQRTTLEASLRESAYLAALTGALERYEDLQPLAGEVVRRLRPLVGADWITVLLGNPKEGFQPVAFDGYAPELLRSFTERSALLGQDDALTLELAQAQPQFIDDYRGLTRTYPAHLAAGVASVAWVPFGQPEQEFGLLGAFRLGTPRPWRLEEQGLLEVTADALSISAQRVTRARQLREAAQYSEVLLQISRLTETALEVEEVAAEVIRTIANVADVDWIGLAVVRGNSVGLRKVWDSPMSIPTADMHKEISPVWEAIEAGNPVYIDDYPGHPRAMAALLEVGVQTVAIIPLTLGERGMAIFAAKFGPDRPWTQKDRSLFEAAARSVRTAQEHRDYLRAVEAAAFTDALTGLGNRRAFDRDLDAALNSARRHGYPVSLLMLDLDGLKQVNDTQGHERGDALLRGFARALHSTLRREDRIYRLGGDEYAAILEHTPSGQSTLAAIRARVDQAIAVLRSGGFPDADVSAGLAAYPADTADPQELVRLADERMYEEKALHRARRARPDGGGRG
ncbi:putative diguanylate cyclase AdrA [Calidithermus terrae]|uniref:Putative diguanylate cyclase AdrA n=1 Tax=Calidithermus terrae TaxID=1408545 RepID=A0A399F6G3_9DEIN|nr:diguanylate cyclase [Calidithermus terrae]RIH90201.1 putative diguanylate cyclase AdrA [Calidithermus terrae]